VPLTDTLLRNALIASQGQPDILPADTRRLSRKQKKNLPSYLPGRTFARALFAFLVPDTHGKTAFNEVETAVNALPGNSALKKSLQNLLANAEGDTEKFRLSIEHWYDDHMDRVSGWYKRRVRWISAGIGAVLILAFNVNAVPIVRTLYSDQALRPAWSTRRWRRPTAATRTRPSACVRCARRSRGCAPSGSRSAGSPTRSAARRAAPGTAPCPDPGRPVLVRPHRPVRQLALHRSQAVQGRGARLSAGEADPGQATAAALGWAARMVAAVEERLVVVLLTGPSNGVMPFPRSCRSGA
jgi:hypothetical protein